MPSYSRRWHHVSTCNPDSRFRRFTAFLRRQLSKLLADRDDPSSCPRTSHSNKRKRVSLDGSSAHIEDVEPEPVYDDTSIFDDDYAPFQTSVVEYNDPIEDDLTHLYQRHHITAPPLPYSFPSPPTPTHTHTLTSSPLTPTLTLQERLQKRAACLTRLQRGSIPDPFGEWAGLAAGLYGDTLPPEFYLSSAPFALHSLRGRARLRFIRDGLSMAPDAGVVHIERFLSRNPSIIRYLVFNVVPNPYSVFREKSHNYGICVESRHGRRYNRRLLRAIKQLDWGDGTLREVVELARTGAAADRAALTTFRKARQREALMPCVYRRMLELEEQPRSMKRWKKKAVAEMRWERPCSLLREAVMPEDVVEVF